MRTMLFKTTMTELRLNLDLKLRFETILIVPPYMKSAMTKKLARKNIIQKIITNLFLHMKTHHMYLFFILLFSIKMILHDSKRCFQPNARTNAKTRFCV